MKTFKKKILELIADPASILTCKTDGFERTLPTDDTMLNHLREAESDIVLIECLNTILPAFLKVCETQLAPCMTGEFSDVTQEVLDATRAADPHNIYGEDAWDAGRHVLAQETDHSGVSGIHSDCNEKFWSG